MDLMLTNTLTAQRRPYLQRAHGKRGDGLALGHDARVAGLSALGRLRLSRDALQVAGGRVSVGAARHADLLGREALEAKAGHRFPADGVVGQVDESGLGQLLLLSLGGLDGGGAVAGQDDVAGRFAAAFGAAALAAAPVHLAIQLLEELAVADVDGLGAGQLGADGLGGAAASFLPAHGQRVAGVVGHVLQVHLGHAGRHGVEVGALLKGEGTNGGRGGRGGGLLFSLDGRALGCACRVRRRREMNEVDQEDNENIKTSYSVCEIHINLLDHHCSLQVIVHFNAWRH